MYTIGPISYGPPSNSSTAAALGILGNLDDDGDAPPFSTCYTPGISSQSLPKRELVQNVYLPEYLKKIAGLFFFQVFFLFVLDFSVHFT